jgi:hypothetical protein
LIFGDARSTPHVDRFAMHDNRCARPFCDALCPRYILFQRNFSWRVVRSKGKLLVSIQSASATSWVGKERSRMLVGRSIHASIQIVSPLAFKRNTEGPTKLEYCSRDLIPRNSKVTLWDILRAVMVTTLAGGKAPATICKDPGIISEMWGRLGDQKSPEPRPRPSKSRYKRVTRVTTDRSLPSLSVANGRPSYFHRPAVPCINATNDEADVACASPK